MSGLLITTEAQDLAFRCLKLAVDSAPVEASPQDIIHAARLFLEFASLRPDLAEAGDGI
jgi:hypothetical protein